MSQSINYFNNDLLKLATKKQAKEQFGAPNWWYKTSNKCKIINVIYIIVLAFTFFVNAIIITNYSWRSGDLEGIENANLKTAYLNNARAFVFSTVLLIFGFILMVTARKIKKSVKKPTVFAIISTALSFIGGVITAITSSNILLGRNIDEYAEAVEETHDIRIWFEFFGFHIVPIVIILLCAILLTVAIIKYKNDISRIYKGLSENAFSEFTAKNPKYSEREWEQYLKTYVKERMVSNEDL